VIIISHNIKRKKEKKNYIDGLDVVDPSWGNYDDVLVVTFPLVGFRWPGQGIGSNIGVA
jgi:hypothetical protein